MSLLPSQISISTQDNPSRYALPTVVAVGDYYRIDFNAMASDCQILIDCALPDTVKLSHLARIAIREVWRIEHKFSRYKIQNDLAKLHEQRGCWQVIDDETSRLLDFAEQAWSVSQGMFDISSGILRKVWTFDGGQNVPTVQQVNELRQHIGWQKVLRRTCSTRPPKSELFLPQGMELDLGGIAKEYAVDRALGVAIQFALKEKISASIVVNLGGDLACSSSRLNGQPWKIGIESLEHQGHANRLLELKQGAMATSGDSKRFVLHNGIRYSHVLNPLTGWPVHGAPRAVTIAAPTCVLAGIIATLALLKGQEARLFLENSGFPYWISNENLI